MASTYITLITRNECIARPEWDNELQKFVADGETVIEFTDVQLTYWGGYDTFELTPSIVQSTIDDAEDEMAEFKTRIAAYAEMLKCPMPSDERYDTAMAKVEMAEDCDRLAVTIARLKDLKELAGCGRFKMWASFAD